MATIIVAVLDSTDPCSPVPHMVSNTRPAASTIGGVYCSRRSIALKSAEMRSARSFGHGVSDTCSADTWSRKNWSHCTIVQTNLSNTDIPVIWPFIISTVAFTIKPCLRLPCKARRQKGRAACVFYRTIETHRSSQLPHSTGD